MTRVALFERVGAFAEDKDAARAIRLEEVVPALERGEEVVLDFAGVEAATQSFVHALVSDLIRKRGAAVLERIVFKSCADTVKEVVGIVVEYMQEGGEP